TVGKLFQSVNFVADQSKANYLIAKVDLDKKYQAGLRGIQEHHQATDGAAILDLTDQFNTLKSGAADAAVSSSFISPISSASFMQLKSQVVSHHDMTIGNISQSRVNALGSN